MASKVLLKCLQKLKKLIICAAKADKTYFM